MKNIGMLFWIVALAACSESTRPFDPARDAVVLTAASPTSLSVVAGNSLSEAPTVIATDASGTPRAGVVIAFTVSQGVSSIRGGLETTDTSGRARLTGWTPSPSAGQKISVTATTTHFAGGVVFSVTVLAGPPARILTIAGDNQIAAVRSEVSIKPKALVSDAFGNPVAGAQVRFEVRQGGGTVSPAEVTTDASGNATLSSWVLGDAGDQLLVATAANAAQAFHATALENPSACSQQLALVPVAALASQFTADSCTRDGRFFTIYYVNLATPSAWRFDMHSTAFDSYLEVRDQNSHLVARNNDTQDSKDSRIRALLSPGIYQLFAVSNVPGATGDFSLSFNNANPAPAGCEGLFVMRGDSTASQLLPLTCNGVFLGNTDLYMIHVAAGDSVVVDLHDLSYSGFDLDLLDSDGKTLAKGVTTVNYLSWGVRYSTDKDIDIVVKVSSLDSYAEYTITFK